jgi:hypothetical protein
VCIHSQQPTWTERSNSYHYVDVAIASVLQALWDSGLIRIVFSYDINCKHHINLLRRISAQNALRTNPLSIELQPNVESPTHYLPKVNTWHLHGHIPECSDNFNLRTTPNVGRFTGEQVESPWARLDSLQYTTREMGAGHRRDVISIHMNSWNQEKLYGIGASFLWFEPQRTIARFKPRSSLVPWFEPTHFVVVVQTTLFFLPGSHFAL